MTVNLFVRKIEVVPVEVPDEMMINIIFDNCKENWDKRPRTAMEGDRDDYLNLSNWIAHRYGYVFADFYECNEDSYEYAEVTLPDGEIVPVLEY